MIGFARACDVIAATTRKGEKVTLLGAYLRSLEDDDLRAAARFFTGNPLASSDDRKLSIGGSTIVAAARNVWGVTERELRAAYRATGDLGTALGRFVRTPLDLGLFREPLTPASLATLLHAAAEATGKASGKRRLALCERILASCETELEARYTIKLLTGDLRIGLREGLVLDGIAAAFGREPEAVRRAAMAAGDAGAVALAARADTLAEIEVRFGAPAGFMLATPIAFGSSYRELAVDSWIVEDKYDGIRAQVHKRGDSVRLFSRTHSDIGRSFPEVVDAFAAQAGDFIVDGEIVARRDGRVLPFRYLQTRLQRKEVNADLQRSVPVAFVAFDILAAGDELLLDDPLSSRRRRLESTLAQTGAVEIAPSRALEPDATQEHIAATFDAARERGNEGVVFKRLDSPYATGRRGKWWLKLKRELSTLDTVIVAVEWGHGKRNRVLSDYTFAVRAESGSDRLLTIGKAYSGLTDAEIAEMTAWFLAHRTGDLGHAIAVEPSVVVEIAFDIVQKSTLHDSGYSLRFPRIVRLRPDKPATEIDCIADVERIYAEMLAREGVDL